jgi:hypothetical protein
VRFPFTATDGTIRNDFTMEIASMNTSRISQIAAFACVSAFAGFANANICYIIYDRNDQTVFRDIRPPIDLSQPIGMQVDRKWRGGALVIVDGADKCVPVETDTPRINVAVADGATQASGPPAVTEKKGARAAKTK